MSSLRHTTKNLPGKFSVNHLTSFFGPFHIKRLRRCLLHHWRLHYFDITQTAALLFRHEWKPPPTSWVICWGVPNGPEARLISTREPGTVTPARPSDVGPDPSTLSVEGESYLILSDESIGLQRLLPLEEDHVVQRGEGQGL